MLGAKRIKFIILRFLSFHHCNQDHNARKWGMIIDASVDWFTASVLQGVRLGKKSCLSIGYWYFCCCHQAVTTSTVIDHHWRPDDIHRPPPHSIRIPNCLFGPFSQGSKYRISGPGTPPSPPPQVWDPHSATPLLAIVLLVAQLGANEP